MSREIAVTAAEAISEDRIAGIADTICRIPSAAGAEGPLADAIAALVDDGRADVHVQEVVPGRPNVIARRSGRSGGRQLVLSGHLDCGVTAGWTADPFVPRVLVGRLYAGGVTDAKASLIAMVAAFEAAGRLELTVGELVLIAAMGHNPVGLGVKYALASDGPWAGSAVFCQSSSMQLHLANGGAAKFEILLTGRSAHISQPQGALDALEAAEAIVGRIRRMRFTHQSHSRLPDLPRIVVGEFHSGTAPARIPGNALIRGDVRTVPGMTRRSIAEDLVRVVDQGLPSGITAVTRITHIQDSFIAEETSDIAIAFAEAHRLVTGTPMTIATGLPTESFITDAADLARAGLETVMYGPGTWQSGPGEESVAITEIAHAAQIYLAAALLLQ